MARNLLVSSALAIMMMLMVVVSGETHHKCIHDSAAIQRKEHDGMDKVVPQPGSEAYRKRRLDALKKGESYFESHHKRQMNTQQSGVGELRVVASTLDLDDSNVICTATGQSRSDFQGGTKTCQDYDVLTTEKKAILKEKILPAAITQIAYQLKVSQLTSNLIVGSNACPQFNIPSSHSTSGVASADFALYVTSVPSSEGNLAWAATCSTDADGRPTVGQANFNPRYIEWYDSAPSIGEAQVATAVHEILHALGFSSSRFNSTTTATVSGRSKTVTYIDSPEVTRISREFFGCDTLTGGEVEDEGSSGSAGSHWDRRVLKDEMMAAAGGDIFSIFTLAAMADMGHYTVDYTRAESIEWGQNSGCGFHTNKCNTAAGGSGTYFCFDNSEDLCTYKKESIGYCPILSYSSSLPSQFQYFSDTTKGGQEFYDYCPVPTGYSNRLCSNSSITPSTNDETFGQYFGSGGKCFETTGLIKDGFTAPATASGLRCLQSRCIDTPARVQFQVGVSEWLDCPTDGSAGDVNPPAGWQGQVKCPAATDICSSTNTFTPQPPTPQPPVPDATPVPDSVTAIPAERGDETISGTLTLTGLKTTWDQVLTSAPTALENSLKTDIARIWSLNPQLIRVSNFRTGSLIFDYGMIQVTSVTRDEVQKKWNELTTDRFWLQDTFGVYRTYATPLNDATLIELEKGTTTEGGNAPICGQNYNTEECNYILFAAGGGAAIILLTLICVCCCCCREPSSEEMAKLTQERRAKHYRAAQQQHHVQVRIADPSPPPRQQQKPSRPSAPRSVPGRGRK